MNHSLQAVKKEAYFTTLKDALEAIDVYKKQERRGKIFDLIIDLNELTPHDYAVRLYYIHNRRP